MFRWLREKATSVTAGLLLKAIVIAILQVVLAPAIGDTLAWWLAILAILFVTALSLREYLFPVVRPKVVSFLFVAASAWFVKQAAITMTLSPSASGVMMGIAAILIAYIGVTTIAAIARPAVFTE